MKVYGRSLVGYVNDPDNNKRNNRENEGEIENREEDNRSLYNLTRGDVERLFNQIAEENRDFAETTERKVLEEMAQKNKEGGKANEGRGTNTTAKRLAAEKSIGSNKNPQPNRHGSATKTKPSHNKFKTSPKSQIANEKMTVIQNRPSSQARISGSMETLNPRDRANIIAGNAMLGVRESGILRKVGRGLNAVSAFLTNTNPSGRLDKPGRLGIRDRVDQERNRLEGHARNNAQQSDNVQQPAQGLEHATFDKLAAVATLDADTLAAYQVLLESMKREDREPVGV